MTFFPPPLEELDEVLAFIFTGPCLPTKKDIKRTPLLVRRKFVGKALQWLILNHADYQDVELSEANLHKYPEEDTPVVIDYRESIINQDREATGIHKHADEEGAESGDCPFVVQGLTGEEFSTMKLEAIKALQSPRIGLLLAARFMAERTANSSILHWSTPMGWYQMVHGWCGGVYHWMPPGG